MPTGKWPKDQRLREIGLFSQLAVIQDAEGFILFLTGVLGWPKDRVHVFIAHVRKELRAGEFHYFSNQRVVWGQKPKA